MSSKNKETVEIPLEELENWVKIGRIALVAGFTLIVIMLFHVLIDFFYHA